MKFKKYIIVVFVITLAALLSLQAEAKSWRQKQKTAEPQTAETTPATSKNIALGDVDAGYNMSGGKAYQVKETIQILVKRELEKMGHNVKITSPAVVVAGSQPKGKAFPTLPTNRAPTQQELADYMSAMQHQQKVMSGQVLEFKPAPGMDAYVDFKVESGQSGRDTSGAVNTLSSVTGIDMSMGDMSSRSTKVHLVCTMRDPNTGALVDRLVAKAESVQFRNLGGYTSYNYGSDFEKREKLFNRAAKKCAKWIGKRL